MGDAVRLFNGRHGEFEARVAEVSKRAVVLAIGEQRRRQVSSPDLWLAFAPVKKSATDLIVEKAVELGVVRLLPLRTQRCNAQSVRSDRFERIAIEAAEQSERLDIPRVDAETSLPAFLDELPEERLLVFCDEAGDDASAPWGGEEGRAPPIAAAIEGRGHGPACLLVGPEGGFAPEERTLLRAKSNVLAVSLGPRILKAETAVIAALAVWQSICGDWAGASSAQNPPQAPEN